MKVSRLEGFVFFATSAVALALGTAGGPRCYAVAPAALTLGAYLAEVKSHSPSARAAVESVKAAEFHLNFARSSFMPEFYAGYSMFDNRERPTNPIAPSESRGNQWKLGVRQTTKFGLTADAGFIASRSQLLGVNPLFLPLNDYEQTSLALKVTQELWRNGFGETSGASFARQESVDRATLLQAQFDLKNILLKAENTYWSLVSYQEVIKLQTENVDRARGLRDHMRDRANLNLSDDVDALQTEASLQSRELELASSLNDRQSLVREFNTLRGADEDKLEALDELPREEFLLRVAKDPGHRMAREDFRIAAERASQQEAAALGAISQLKPQLNLVGGISGNGLDNQTTRASHQALQLRNPDWNIGLTFSVPLDFGLIGETMRSFRAQKRAAAAMAEASRFEEDRAWDALLKNQREAQSIFERSIALERLETDLVKKERRRLMNGRSTTLQTVTIEQNLALAQIARVKAQLALLQIHNLTKQFTEAK